MIPNNIIIWEIKFARSVIQIVSNIVQGLLKMIAENVPNFNSMTTELVSNSVPKENMQIKILEIA